MKELQYYAELLALLAFMLLIVAMHGITTYLILTEDASISVSVRDRTQGEISAFTFLTQVNVSQRQDIVVEFTNTGTSNYTATIFVNVYRLNGSLLNQTANYQDSPSFLHPGMRTDFSTVYVTNISGLYFIQARVTFGTRTTETWGSFFVVDPFVQPPGGGTITPGTGGGGTGGGGGGGGPPVIINVTTIKPPPAAITATGPKNITVNWGDSVLARINITNTGQTDLHNIRFFVSTTNTLFTDINPKTLASLTPWNPTFLLITLSASESTEPGKHLLTYQIVADEASTSGTIDVYVTNIGFDPTELYFRILNYQALILDVEEKLLQYKLQGLNMAAAEVSLDNAKESLERAKIFYNAGQYVDTRDALRDTKDDIEKSVLLLGAASYYVYTGFALDLFLILIILIAVLAVLFFYYWRKRKKKPLRPRMLREATEEK